MKRDTQTLSPAMSLHDGVPQTSARPDAARTRRPRVLYAAGDGDLLGTYQHWKDRRDDPSQVSMTYSGQFFDACERLDWDGIVLSRCEKTSSERSGQFTILQRPMLKFRGGPAPMYHLEQVWSALRVAASAVANRADVVIVASGVSHWFPLAMLPLLGIKVVPTLHCVLWPKFSKPGRVSRMIHKLDAALFSRFASSVMTASSDIEDQLTSLTGTSHPARTVPFLPSYRREHFPTSSVPPTFPPFRVLYAGRIEREKGVFDLLEIAKRLQASGRAEFQFEICGAGSALEELQTQAADAGLAARFRCHGHCDRPTMVAMFQRCHVVIVPTTSSFVEGFNQVVAEAILVGRPVVTSTVCPAIRYLGEAAIALPPDQIDGYVEVVERLATDKSFYEQTRAACAKVREQFFDQRRGWGAALETALRQAKPKYFEAGIASAVR